MKVNFWQILGIVILIIGLVLVLRKQTAKNDVVPAKDNAPATHPANP